MCSIDRSPSSLSTNRKFEPPFSPDDEVSFDYLLTGLVASLSVAALVSRRRFERSCRHRRQGRRILRRTSKAPLSNSQGRSIGVLGVYDDIKALKGIENELRLTKTMLDRRKTAIFWINRARSSAAGSSC